MSTLDHAIWTLRTFRDASWKKNGAAWIRCLRHIASRNPEPEGRFLARWMLQSVGGRIDSQHKAFFLKSRLLSAPPRRWDRRLLVLTYFDDRRMRLRAPRFSLLARFSIFYLELCLRRNGKALPREMMRHVMRFL